MNGRQRRKLFAGAGLISMLLGGAILVAPTGAGAEESVRSLQTVSGNPSCASLGYDVEAKFDDKGNPGDSGTASETVTVDDVEYTLDVAWTFEDDGTISFEVTEASDLLVSAVIVKQANGANVYRYAPPTSGDSGLVDNEGDQEFSHLSFCGDIPAETTTTVEETTTTTTEATTTTTEATTTTTEATTTTTEATTTTTQPTTTTTIEVEDTGVENTTTTTAGEAPTTTAGVSPTEAPKAEVKGDVVVRSLPRTGQDSLDLAGLGAVLLLAGACMVALGGRRRVDGIAD